MKLEQVMQDRGGLVRCDPISSDDWRWVDVGSVELASKRVLNERITVPTEVIPLQDENKHILNCLVDFCPGADGYFILDESTVVQLIYSGRKKMIIRVYNKIERAVP